MTIHEKYNERKEQYLKYSAEIQVYNTQMQQLISQLKTNIADMKNAAEAIQNTELRSQLCAILDKLEQDNDLADNAEFLKQCYDDLEKLSVQLEEDIRRALDG